MLASPALGSSISACCRSVPDPCPAGHEDPDQTPEDTSNLKKWSGLGFYFIPVLGNICLHVFLICVKVHKHRILHINSTPNSNLFQENERFYERKGMCLNAVLFLPGVFVRRQTSGWNKAFSMSTAGETGEA